MKSPKSVLLYETQKQLKLYMLLHLYLSIKKNDMTFNRSTCGNEMQLQVKIVYIILTIIGLSQPLRCTS